MALKAVVGFNGGIHQLGKRDLMRNGHLSAPSSLSWRLEVSKSGRLECEGVQMKPVDDKNVMSASSPVEVEKETGNGGRKEEQRKWNRDLASLPSGFLPWYCLSSCFLDVVADYTFNLPFIVLYRYPSILVLLVYAW